jgi:hypothetical protein
MTQITPPSPPRTKVALLAYQGVTAAYIRDLARHPRTN